MKKHEITPDTYKGILDSASTHPQEVPEKKEYTNPDKVNWVLYGMLIVLVAFGAFVYIRESLIAPPIYHYTNGDSEFEVRRISDTESQIQFYYGTNPEPFIMDIRYGPIDVEDIKIDDPGIKQKIQDDEVVYITFDPDEELKGEAALAGLEIGKFIANKYFFNVPVKNAVTKPYDNNTIANCDNATSTSTVIQIKKGDGPKIETNGNCITVQGPTETDMVKAADRLALQLVGIMP